MPIIEVTYNKYPSVDKTMNQILPVVEDNLRRLEMIQDLVIIPSICDLEQLFEKFARIYNGEKIVLSEHEQRTLSYHFYELEQQLINYYFKTYLLNNWNKVCIKGLMHAITQRYHERGLLELFRGVLDSNLDDFSQVELSAYQYLIDGSGPKNLASLLHKNSNTCDQAPIYVLLQRTMFTYCYFEDVIIEYFKVYSAFDKQNDHGLEETLNKYNKKRFNKILLPDIILRLKQKFVPDDVKSYFVNLCVKLIGDPNNYSLWQDHTLSNSEKDALRNTHHTIRCWMLEKVIYKVFDGARGDFYAERSNFWKQYAKRLLEFNPDTPVNNFFRIYTSEPQKVAYLNTLGWNNVNRLDQQSETVVIMRFGDYSIVEYLSGGCMYVYKKMQDPTKGAYGFVWSRTRVYYADTFQLTTVELYHKDIQYGATIPPSFKVAHRGGWGHVFKYLLTRLGIRP